MKISNFIALFCLKGTLVQPKTVAGVSCCDTEGPSKVWGKTDSWFPIQPRKNCANLIDSGEKGQNLKFHRLVLAKR